MNVTPGAIRHTGRDLGADTDEILRDTFKLDEKRVKALQEGGAF